MKRLTWFLIVFTLFLYSCGNDKYTTEQKNYLLPDQYENIGQQGYIYIPHISAEFVSVLNPSGMKLIGQVPAGKGPCSMLILKDGSKGYIANFNSNDITVFDAKTNKKLAVLKTTEHPQTLFELPGKNKVLIGHQSSNGMSVINTNDDSITEMNELNTGLMYYIKTRDRIYMPQIFTPFIHIIDPVTLQIEKQIETGGRPMAMTVTKDEKFAYLANYDSTEVAKIDLTTDNVILKIKDIHSPRGINISPDNSLVAVTNVRGNSVTLIEPANDKVKKTIYGLLMPVDVIFTADNNYLLVCNQGNGTISVIDIKSLEIKENIKVASNPITLYGDYR